MPYLIGVGIKVEDYAKWKACFDAGEETRKAAGERSYQLFRTAEDPNNLFLLCQWDSAESARAFLASDQLRKAQEESGVMQLPETFVLEELDGTTH